MHINLHLLLFNLISHIQNTLPLNTGFNANLLVDCFSFLQT